MACAYFTKRNAKRGTVMEANFVQIRNLKIATKTMTNEMQTMVKEIAKHVSTTKSMFVHQKASLIQLRKVVDGAVKALKDAEGLIRQQRGLLKCYDGESTNGK